MEKIVNMNNISKFKYFQNKFIILILFLNEKQNSNKKNLEYFNEINEELNEKITQIKSFSEINYKSNDVRELVLKIIEITINILDDYNNYLEKYKSEKNKSEKKPKISDDYNKKPNLIGLYENQLQNCLSRLKMICERVSEISEIN